MGMPLSQKYLYQVCLGYEYNLDMSGYVQVYTFFFEKKFGYGGVRRGYTQVRLDTTWVPHQVKLHRFRVFLLILFFFIQNENPSLTPPFHSHQPHPTSFSSLTNSYSPPLNSSHYSTSQLPATTQQRWWLAEQISNGGELNTAATTPSTQKQQQQIR